MHTVLHIQQKMDVPSGQRLQETMVKIIVFFIGILPISDNVT